MNDQKQQETTCEWKPDPDEFNNVWGTECWNAFEFANGGPSDNGFNFCPYCGDEIRERAEVSS